MQQLGSMCKILALCAVMIVAFVFVVRPEIGYAQVPASPTTDVCGAAGNRCNAFIETYVNPFILLLSGLVGVLAVISMIMAGIQYAGSADDPGVVGKAKQRIFNTVLGVLAYIFLFAFLNYLIPGGIL